MLSHLCSVGTDHFYYCKYKVKWHTQSQKGQLPPWFAVCCFNTQDDPFQLETFPFPDGKLLPSSNTKIRSNTKSAAVFFTLCLRSSSFLGLYTGINYLPSCSAEVAGLQSLQREELDYRGIYLLETDITFQNWKHKCCTTQACPAHAIDTVLLGHSALGCASISCHHHLIPPSSLTQAKPQDLKSSEAHLVFMKQLWEGD